MARKLPKVPMAQVIRNPADATADYYIPLEVAKRLYAEGKLAWDCNNNCYCTK